MRDTPRNVYLEEKQKFWFKNGQPTGFVIHHSFWLDLIEPNRQDLRYPCGPPPEKCPKFEGLNVYRTPDGPDNFIRFF